MGLDAVAVQATGAGHPWGDHRVIKNRFDDGLLTVQTQTRPLLAQEATGAGQLIDGGVSVAAAISRRACVMRAVIGSRAAIHSRALIAPWAYNPASSSSRA